GGHAEEESMVASEEVNIEMSVTSEDLAEATITYTEVENGVEVQKEKVFTGTETEVKMQLEAFEKSIADVGTSVIKEMEVIKQ
ncbi:MAG: hypothetical protein HRU26_15450, partial [Psychroserpens sp.]|nr:hypothetical protein [Psychroserpens sp.]